QMCLEVKAPGKEEHCPNASPKIMQAALRSSVEQREREISLTDSGPPVDTSLTLSKLSDCTVADLHDLVVESIGQDIEQVTGEPGDVALDERLAYGNAALTFQDVSFRMKDPQNQEEKIILVPCSGHFEPGTLVALMGPSGSGKTTLLDILADKKTSPYEGKVHMNGRPRDCLFPRLTSYVPQDDIMFPNVTVKEQVMFHTVLKTEVPYAVSKAMISKATELRLRAVGLEGVQHEYIGSDTNRGISGGQRRRVSLACGLATGAQIFFCDEPTSGLSATDAEQCVRYMRLLCKKYNVTIILAIHQPRQEVAVLFDHLLLLTANPGDLVYNGRMRDAAEYWSNAGFPVPTLVSPTDYFLDLVTPGGEDSQAQHFLDYFSRTAKPEIESQVNVELNYERPTSWQLLNDRREILTRYGDMPPLRKSVYGVRFRTQLLKVFCRQLRLLVRDQQGLITDILVAIVQGLLVGSANIGIGNFSGYNQAGFFFMLIMTCALSGIKVMPKALSERTVMKMEVSEVLYNDWAYILSFTFLNGIVSVLSNSIFVLVVFILSKLQWEVFPAVLLWNSVIFVAMDSLYGMVAAMAKDASSAQIILTPFLTLAMLFNGFTVSRKSVPAFMLWALEMSPVSHTLEELTYSIQRTTDSMELQIVIDQFGYESSIKGAIIAAASWFFVCRLVQEPARDSEHAMWCSAVQFLNQWNVENCIHSAALHLGRERTRETHGRKCRVPSAIAAAKPNWSLEEAKLDRYFVDVALALCHLHSHTIVHRDLKPENILMCGTSPMKAKLADFGWCAELQKDARTTFCGTWDYLSPEMVENQPHDSGVDIWAIGILLFEMLTGRAPFAASSQVKVVNRIINVDLQVPSSVPPLAADLMQKLIKRLPHERLGLKDALKSPWVLLHAPTSSFDLTQTYEGLKGLEAEKRMPERGAKELQVDSPRRRTEASGKTEVSPASTVMVPAVQAVTDGGRSEGAGSQSQESVSPASTVQVAASRPKPSVMPWSEAQTPTEGEHQDAGNVASAAMPSASPQRRGGYGFGLEAKEQGGLLVCTTRQSKGL
ncbi:ABC transporter G family member 22 (ABC transporter ABCG.22), partial [Durusdinium trenchii]